MHKIRINGYRRRRPVPSRMREILDHMGVKGEVAVSPHERGFTPRRRAKKVEPKVDLKEME